MNIRRAGFSAVLVASVSLMLAGCVTAPQQRGYHQGYGQRSDYGRCQSCGVVQDVQQVYVQGSGNGTLGAVIGALAGGVLGNQVGKGDGRKAATVAGAVAGGVVGNQVGKRSGGDTPAWRVVVRLDNGQYATVTQREDPQLRNGDYVEVRGDRVYQR